MEANVGGVARVMYSGDFLKDAKSRIQMVLLRDRKTLADFLFVGLLAVMAFLFLPVLLLLDLVVFALKAFGL